MKTEEEIDIYILGKMTAEEAERFGEAILADPELEETVDLRRQLIAALKISELSQLKDRLAVLEKDIAKQKPAISMVQVFRMAAVLILAVGAGYYIWQFSNTTSGSDLFAQYMEPYPNYATAIVRGEEATSKEQEAYSYYEASNYKLASQLLQELYDQSNDDQTLFYLANSKMMLNNYSEALDDLTKMDLESSEFKEQAVWYIGLLNLKLDRISEAKTYFELVLSKNGFKSEEAAIILKTLAI